MSVYRELTIKCDGTRRNAPCKQTMVGHNELETAKARQLAAHQGWSRSGLDDLCPYCTATRAKKGGK